MAERLFGELSLTLGKSVRYSEPVRVEIHLELEHEYLVVRLTADQFAHLLAGSVLPRLPISRTSLSPDASLGAAEGEKQ